ncbi:MAG TPA: phosphatase PAP2 family protein [Paludibacter sp.]|nr:phosphatase PAP2 family protein [Paludibacter sp.]
MMKKYWAFYVPYLVFVLAFLLLVLCNSKADLHLWMTSFNSPAADIFFHYYTYVGDWVPFAVVGGLLFFRYRIALLVLAAQLVSAVFSTSLKHIFNESRPSLYFSQHFPSVSFHHVAGEHLYTTHSFPSGHTITAFAFFMMLAFYTRHNPVRFLYFVLAFLVGYSRVYLSQHFAVDVLAGSAIGVLVSVFCYQYIDNKLLAWADSSIYKDFKKKSKDKSLLSEI